MRYVYWVRTRAGRLLVMLLAMVIYSLLLTLDGLRFFPQAADSSSTLLHVARFGFSAFVALIFLAVGALVWLYARDRRVALLLFCFSFVMMLSFAVQTGATSNDPLLSTIGDASSAISPYLFLILLLLFPRDYLSLPLQSGVGLRDRFQSNGQYYLFLLLRGYLIVLALLSAIVMLDNALYYLLTVQLSGLSNTIDYIYYLFVLPAIILTIIVSYRQSTSLRERQQLRFFVGGVILAFAPFLVLTVLPLLLNLPSGYVVDSQVSTATAILLPLSLGYSILRYQILVFDMYVRRAVAWIAGGVSLAVLGYLVFTLSDIFLSHNTLLYAICLALALLVLSPSAWWLARVITERLFFNEIRHYRQLIDRPNLLSRETIVLDEGSRLLTLAAVDAFETQEVCLFVLDAETGYYQLSPALKEGDTGDVSRRLLMRHLLDTVKLSTGEITQIHRHVSLTDGADWLDANAAIIMRVDAAKRPLFLSEACKAEEDQPTGLARYLIRTAPLGKDPLLAPVRVQSNMIGLLVLGERGDHQPYAGPDFEVIDLLLSRFSPVLETARLYQQASRHVATLDALYSANITLEKPYQSIEEVAIAYATAAAEAVQAGAEVWLYDKTERSLRHILHTGSGPGWIAQKSIGSLQESDWSPWFYDGESPRAGQGLSSHVPPCLPRMPGFPFAWLPLDKGGQRYGVLVLVYPRPHIFSQQERRILEMFAVQCAAAIENAQITIALRAAYEHQKELDRLKDQFITTASHELRTPLTAVQGYIELLHQYNARLSPEERADFIAKAHRGCDELVLMVNNIMDASHVQIDIEQVRLKSVSLIDPVLHVLEIVEGIARREKRAIRLEVPTDIVVMADELRLRQILLNLVSNAFKYSPAGTPIEIAAEQHDQAITVHVRDYGPGILPEDQQRLFERFTRLERDINSPVRGAGLGLYISKQLVEAMGGQIWVESAGKPGEGSDFCFTLKCMKVDQALHPVFGQLEHQEV